MFQFRIASVLMPLVAVFLWTAASAQATGNPATLDFSGGPAKVLSSFPTSSQFPSSKPLVADVSGDGKADLVYVRNGAWYVSVASATSFGPAKKLVDWIGPAAANDYFFTGDVNSDGRQDPIRIANGTWYMCPTITVHSASSASCTPTTYSGFGYTSASNMDRYKGFVADMNADGRSDLVSLRYGQWRVALGLPGGGWQPVSTIWNHYFGGPIIEFTPNVMLADVSGDGRPDAVYEFLGAWHVALNTGSTFGADLTWRSEFPAQMVIGGNRNIMLARIDANSSYDAVTYVGGQWFVGLSSGTAFGAPQLWDKGFGSPNGDQPTTYFAADIDNAGAFKQADAVAVVSGDWYTAARPGIGGQIAASGSGWSTAGPTGLASEFNSDLETTAKWSYQRSDGLNTGLPARNPYSNVEGANYEPEQNTHADGALVQTINELSSAVDGNSYKTGSINSFGKFSFQYGYVEARISVPVCAGCFPAFWLLPTAGLSSYPSEIDIFEFFPNYLGGLQPQGNVHWPTGGLAARPTTVRSSWPWPTTISNSYAGNYHTYGLLWTADTLQFFVDGFASTKFTETQTFEIPDEPMYLINTLQQRECIPRESDGECSGDLYDTPDGTAKMYTDYIHVYK